MRNSSATRGSGTALTPEQRESISRDGRIARVLDATRRQANGRFARAAARAKPSRGRPSGSEPHTPS